MNEKIESSLIPPSGDEEIKLTQYSRGAGCGCKIAPKVLDEILKSSIALPDNNKLLVGNHFYADCR